MQRHFLALGLTGLLALAACGGTDSTSAGTGSDTVASANSDSGRSTDKAIKSAKDCAALMTASQPVFIKLFQGLVDQAQTMSTEELAKLATSGAETPKLICDFQKQLETDGKAIEERAKELDCSEDDAQKAMCDAVAEIDGKGNTLAETIISGMTAQCA